MLVLGLQAQRMAEHGAEHGYIQRMLKQIVFPASESLDKVDFMIQVSVTLDNIADYRLNFTGFTVLPHTLHLFFNAEYLHHLKTLKFYIVLSHRRYRLRRFQNKDSDQTERFNAHNPLPGQLGIALIQQYAISVINRPRQTHPDLQIITLYKLHLPTPLPAFKSLQQLIS